MARRRPVGAAYTQALPARQCAAQAEFTAAGGRALKCARRVTVNEISTPERAGKIRCNRPFQRRFDVIADASHHAAVASLEPTREALIDER